MGRRRNVITRDQELIVRAIAALSGAVAAMSGAEPTGETAVDIVILVVVGAFVTWAGATASWWALMSGAGLAAAAAIVGPIAIGGPAVAALGLSALLSWNRRNQPVVRAAIAAIVVQVVLRLEWNPFFLSSAMVAAVAGGVIVLSGVLRRPSYIRKRVYVTAGGVGGLWLLSLVLFGVSIGGAMNSAQEGYRGMLDGLDLVKKGETTAAAEGLRAAAIDLRDASENIDNTLGQPARVVPVLAQNRTALVDVMSRSADAAEAAAAALDLVFLDQLSMSNGVIDTTAFQLLADPLVDLESTIVELDQALHAADNPWLLAPFQARVDDALDKSRQVLPQARATVAAARVAPAMLGAEGERRYFIAFVNPAEARGSGGLMGNWSEVTITNGRLEVTANGRTADLQSDALLSLVLDEPPEFMARYGEYGADIGGFVDPKYWSNVTVSPDMPSVASAMAQMYETVTGKTVDGVFLIDPAGIARLIDVTGPIQLETIDRRIDASNVEYFLTLGQYEFAENEREDFLTEVTDQTVDNLLGSTLPEPQLLASILADAAIGGHINAWAKRPEEQEMLRLVGMDGGLPIITEDGMDAFAVSSNNGSGNKIESFLERRISYDARVNESTGDVAATLTIELTNTAPTTGYPDYVIGNLLDLPTGTNRMVLDVHTVLQVQTAAVDGENFTVDTLPELGYNVWTTTLEIPPGSDVTIVLQLAGNVGPGQYRLVYRPQALPNTDLTSFEADTFGEVPLFKYDDRILRRTVLSADRVEAWR